MRLPRRAAEPDPTPTPTTGSPPPQAQTKRPLYPRVLGLRHVRPNGWQRAALGEGSLVLAILLVLADLATAWTLVVLPVAVAVVVKAHDVLAGLLQQDRLGTTTTPVPAGSRRRRAED